MKRSELSPAPLMQLATGFWAFKTLAASHELGLFDLLSGSAGVTAEELAARWRIELRPADMILTACAALGLLDQRDGRYYNTELAEAYLVSGKPHYFGGFIQMLDKRLYPGWGRLTEAIRTNRPTTWDPDTQRSLFEGEDPAMLALFWEAMHGISSVTASELGEAVDLSSCTSLLDLGGGSGAYDIELCRIYPRLRATVYDLPFVAEIAGKKIAEAGLADRIEAVSGDFFADDDLPQGHDCILLSMIMHDWTEEQDRAILAKCFESLPSGGLVIISELLVNDEKTGPPAAALMSLNMLIETEGRNYTPAEYSEWLREQGFVQVRTVWFNAPGANGAVLATKP